MKTVIITINKNVGTSLSDCVNYYNLVVHSSNVETFQFTTSNIMMIEMFTLMVVLDDIKLTILENGKEFTANKFGVFKEKPDILKEYENLVYQTLDSQLKKKRT